MRPGEQRRENPADALARARGREAEDVLRAVVAQGERAVRYFARAVALDPWLEREVPESLRAAVSAAAKSLDALRSQDDADGADED